MRELTSHKVNERGPFACDANERALRWLMAAQGTLLDHARERIARGVEGTHQK